MLLSRRAAVLAHTTFARQLPLRKLFNRLGCSISEQTSACGPLPPPTGVAPVFSQGNSSTVDDLFDFGMGEELVQAQIAPLAKRQRTDDGPPTNRAGGDAGAGAADAKSNGAQHKQQSQKGQGDGAQRRKGGQKDPRIPAMQIAVKFNNLKYALKIFGEAVAEGCSLQTPIINSLMYLACGGEQWERYARGLPPLTEAELAAAAAAAAAAAPVGEGGAGAGDGDAGMAEAQEAQKQPEQKQKQQRGGRPGKHNVPQPEGPPPTREELVAAMDELWSYMGSAGLQPDQATYLALARLESLKGDPKAALEWAMECGRKRKPVQLRLFHPAQVGCCLAADVEQLHHIDSLITSHHLDHTEYEYARLLEGIAAGGTYEQMRAVLLRMQSDLNELSPATADYIAAYFAKSDADQQQQPSAAAPASTAAAGASADGAPGADTASAGADAASAGADAASAGADAASAGADAASAGADAALSGADATLPGADGASAGAVPDAAAGADAAVAVAAAVGDRRWRVLRDVTVAADGLCEAAGGSLKVIDLEDKDWEAFATAIAELARKNMGNRAGDFDAYVEWYNRNGPYDVLMDAANVAFFGQNFDGGGFNWRQVQDMYDMLHRRFEGKKILVMTHRKRINDPEARTPAVQTFLDKLRRTKSFYHTPPGANDDWFWLYACVRSKHNGLLVSNDELRDHIFSLLRPKHFLKWKERHIAHYRFASTNPAITAAAPPGGMFTLVMPHPYTACVQQLAESGAWVVPLTGGSWLCVRPERAG